ncbi:phosphatase PAP2 family protein [Kribbella monticola]|uniref:phosphatase PAP2 family protein n=1 Tax=Kribbella monticola TaxID=2185285 RepID=UPI0013004A54|nr:phosphatase PAP2 family protein [Kribbella monticola]
MAAQSRKTGSRLPQRAYQIAREVALIATAIVLYFGVRGLIETRVDLAYRNAENVIALEKSAGVFAEPELQAAAGHHAWLIDAVSYFYIYGHWPVLLTALLWLLIRHRDAYRTFRNAMLISGGIGLAIFALFPVAPPRFLVGYGFIDTVTQQTSAYRVLQPPAFVNQYAAVPSLHFGWNLLMGIAIAGLAGQRLLRLFGWLMPAAMLASIVLTANHYLFDGLAGGVIALVGLLLATRLARTRAGRQTPPARRPIGQRPAGERPVERQAESRDPSGHVLAQADPAVSTSIQVSAKLP